MPNGEKTVKFLTYVGPHPLMDTGTRDMLLKVGDFVEDFTYDKWQQMIADGKLQPANLAPIEETSTEETNTEEQNNENEEM